MTVIIRVGHDPSPDGVHTWISNPPNPARLRIRVVTSALDAETERRIQETLARLVKQQTG